MAAEVTVRKVYKFADPMLDRQIGELVSGINSVNPVMDAVFSNPTSVLEGNPTPISNYPDVFFNPASVING